MHSLSQNLCFLISIIAFLFNFCTFLCFSPFSFFCNFVIATYLTLCAKSELWLASLSALSRQRMKNESDRRRRQRGERDAGAEMKCRKEQTDTYIVHLVLLLCFFHVRLSSLLHFTSARSKRGIMVVCINFLTANERVNAYFESSRIGTMLN